MRLANVRSCASAQLGQKRAVLGSILVSPKAFGAANVRETAASKMSLPGSRSMSVILPPAALRHSAGLGFRLLACVGGIKNLLGDEACVLADFLLDFGRNLRVAFEEILGVLPALAEALAVVGKPGA